jgi:NADPH:quinone reductase-like Zn-dependent oxidoreductase
MPHVHRLYVEKRRGRPDPGRPCRQLDDDRLPEGEVTVAVEYSTLNYKDGLCLTTGGGLVRSYPHVPGIDFAGTVEASDDPRYRPGDKVILTGWRVGERHWGGYATRAAGEGRLAGAPARGADHPAGDGHRHRGADRDAGGAWRWRITGLPPATARCW